MNEDMVNSKPRNGRIVAIEDEASERTSLYEAAKSVGLEVRAVRSIKGLRRCLTEDYPDVASIDWELNGIHMGPELIELVREECEDTACLIYTKHNVLAHAKEYKADVMLNKPPGGNIAPYIAEAVYGAKLGIARRLARTLHTLGENDLPEFALGDRMEQDAERAICERARRFAIQQIARRRARMQSEHGELLDLLRRRSWWQMLDTDDYAKRNWQAKLCILLSYIKANPETVARIVDIDEQIAQEFLKTDGIAAMPEGEPSHNARLLFYVLSHLLDACGYEPEFLVERWVERMVYDRAAAPPPWNETGLESYLLAMGPTGIETSLLWMRGACTTRKNT